MAHDPRLDQLIAWLKQLPEFDDFDIQPASADASFRRYFRITSAQRSWIAMDAPPDKEDCTPFVQVAQLIEAVGVQAPHIFHRDAEQGFMLLSDLGSRPYLDELDTHNADRLYGDAIQSLLRMQTIDDALPAFDSERLQTEMGLFRDWLIGRHLGITLSENQQRTLQSMFDLLEQSALAQTQVFVHRDYHSRNLMVTDAHNPGVIDFQDAVLGPITYDLVSLLKDCYIAWPRASMLNWVNAFAERNPLVEQADAAFIRDFEFMGVQRHLKASGIFARLNHRDGKPGYLDDIPRVLAYIYDTSARYPQLHPLHELLEELGMDADQQTLELIR